MKHQIQVAWFYGEPGHGRGLVDAMSSFGCKGPLHQMIINDDSWFDTADEMKCALDIHFKDDVTKVFHVIEPEALAKEKKKRKKLQIKGCKKMHMISVDKDGWFTMRVVLHVNEKSLISLEFNNEIIDAQLDVTDTLYDHDDSEKVDEDTNDGTLDRKVLSDVKKAWSCSTLLKF